MPRCPHPLDYDYNRIDRLIALEIVYERARDARENRAILRRGPFALVVDNTKPKRPRRRFSKPSDGSGRAA